MIEVKNVQKSFGDFTVLENCSCKIEKGSVYGLVGANGAGKTTLLKLVSGVYRPDGGEVLIDGSLVCSDASVRRRLFFVPDDLYFLPQASMNRMAGFYRGYYPDWSEKLFQKLTQVFELNPKQRLNSFSKGMQRQAAIIL
ncbi:MAG TPA: ATP-binding cassette domain-containing protein, partial [Clostridia bacterium]|nr:ATP-binding cassette domain-containing protein [Clostridia bacterium]